MSFATALTQRLDLAFRWYQGMVNPDTGMLEYLYVPAGNTFVREQCPIRDIASIWDVEVLGSALDRHEMDGVIRTSLSHYAEYLVERDGDSILDTIRLGEPSSIAHSAFMALALLHGTEPRDLQRVARLANGIVHQQRADGSYKVYFGDLPDSGEELYAGEAMLALAEAYGRVKDPRYLESVERGAGYYDAQYFKAGRVSDDVLVFFANWQSQACRALSECTGNPGMKARAAAYVAGMHDQIIASGFYDRVEGRPDAQGSVEVACALEGLNDAYALAHDAGDVRRDRYRRHICTGLAYLLRLQCTNGGAPRENGGFGFSLDDRTQRIDVTGHAAAAFLKARQNGIDCSANGPWPSA